MAQTVHYRNAYFELNGNDMSAFAADVSLNYSSELLDTTAMGATARTKRGGLLNWSVSVKFHQDFTAATGVDAILFPLVGTSTCIAVRPNNSCSSANNPTYSGIAVLNQYPPASGAVGTLLDVQAQWTSSGTLNRASSS